MIKYTDLKDKFLVFNTIEELKNYLVNQWYGLVKFDTISFTSIDNWSGWWYVRALINSPWDGKLHNQIIGIAELGENYER